MLTLEGIVASRGAFSVAASLDFPAGITALIGPSGGGKSTVLDVIAGFLSPDAGRVLWQGADLTTAPPADRPCAVLFQDNNLFPHLTVAGNLGLALPRGLPPAQAKARIAEVLAKVDLAGSETRRPGNLSGGQQARVALARVLLQDRPLLLLDEAFSALGPALRHEMLDLVASAARTRGMQVIMVTHDPGDALRIAGHASVVAEGHVTAPRATEALLADPPEALRAYLGA